MIWVATSKVQILELVSWFAVEVGFESSIFNDDSDIQERNAGGADTIIVGFENHSVLVVVAEVQEFIQFFPSMGPYKKHIVDVTIPDQWFVWGRI